VGNSDSFVENLLQYLCAKNYQNKIRFDKLIAKNKKGKKKFGPMVYIYIYIYCHLTEAADRMLHFAG